MLVVSLVGAGHQQDASGSIDTGTEGHTVFGGSEVDLFGVRNLNQEVEIGSNTKLYGMAGEDLLKSNLNAIKEDASKNLSHEAILDSNAYLDGGENPLSWEQQWDKNSPSLTGGEGDVLDLSTSNNGSLYFSKLDDLIKNIETINMKSSVGIISQTVTLSYQDIFCLTDENSVLSLIVIL